ncbi:MAG: hypothetical protein ACYC5N_04590 [Endomicrobiales bacterium]
MYALLANTGTFSGTAAAVAADAHRTYAHLGLTGMLLLFLRAYSMGAGTYTGIEAVSNGVSAFREPKVETARRTMLYMMVSLAVVVCGVMLLYVLLGVRPRSGKTLNAVLFGYSINVFITFVLSQLGMVRHWHGVRSTEPAWARKMAVNGVGLMLSVTILVSVVVIKFHEGGWITLSVTAALIGIVAGIKNHYRRVARLLRALDDLSRVDIMLQLSGDARPSREDGAEPEFDPKAHTAVILVNGFNGLGLHTLCNVLKMFKGVFRNFVFVQVGIVDVDAFKSAEDIERLRAGIRTDVNRYVDLMRSRGYYAQGVELAGVDVVDEVIKAVPGLQERYPSSVFFGGQLVFPESLFFHRWLHNYTVFALQKRFYHYAIPLMLVPVRLLCGREARYDTGDIFRPLPPRVMPAIDGTLRSGARTP